MMKHTYNFIILCSTLVLATTQSYSIQTTDQRGSIDMEHFYRGTSVLVAGGCGFIGSHLAATLVTLGADVTVIDDLSTGSKDNIENIKHNITFMQASITDQQACIEATKDKKIVFHLAAFISVPQSVKEPHVCHHINVDGTFNLLEAARINGVERFVFSSSAAVYGCQEGICSEDMPCSPESPYGFSKQIGELYCKQFAQQFGINTVALRYFNVYGDRQNPHGHYAAVVAKFKHQMKHNLPITIFGDGTQTRDFIPVDKVAEANLRLGMLPGAQMNGDIFNIATGNSINLLELIELLRQEFPAYAENIIFAPARPGDLKYSQADISKYLSAIS